jgi:hypothetical protein
MNNDLKRCIPNMMNVILNDTELIEFVRDFNEERGFMFSNSPYITTIGRQVDDDHSGASFGTCMRECQYRLKTMKFTNMSFDNI